VLANSNDWFCIGREKIGPKAVSFGVDVRVETFRVVLIEQRTHGSPGARRSH
jgi:hypothetical protein